MPKYGVLTMFVWQFFDAMTTLSHDATNPAVFCSKNIDRLGPSMGWNLRLVRYGVEVGSVLLLSFCP